MWSPWILTLLAGLALGAGCLKLNPNYVGPEMGPGGDMGPDMRVPNADPDLQGVDLTGMPNPPEVLIPGDRVVYMGTRPDMGSEPNEHPAYSTDMGPYYMDVNPVTVADYARCVNAPASPCFPPKSGGHCNWGQAGKEQHPVNCVTWQQAYDFCHWIGRRLPTEEEWELAARRDTSSEYPWGNNPPKDPAAPDTQLCWKQMGTCQVGSYPKTLFGARSDGGLADLPGNVYQWTSSVDQPYPADRGNYSMNSVRCITRGGAWNYVDAYTMRAARRTPDDPMSNGDGKGFRCARHP